MMEDLTPYFERARAGAGSWSRESFYAALQAARELTGGAETDWSKETGVPWAQFSYGTDGTCALRHDMPIAFVSGPMVEELAGVLEARGVVVVRVVDIYATAYRADVRRMHELCPYDAAWLDLDLPTELNPEAMSAEEFLFATEA